jgi:hypothetical protein
MTEEKKSNCKNILKDLSKNYWAVSTIILAILLILTLAINPSDATITANAAGQKVVEFANSQGAEAELVSVKEEGALYAVTLSINDQEVPVYVTKDGENLVPSLVPLEIQETAASEVPTPEVPKSDKPIVEAFVMSHCPYGTQIEKGLIPVMELLGDKIDAEIKFVYYAMHPTSGEVEEQLNQYCIQKDQNDKFLDYLKCFLEEGDGEGCIISTGINKAKLKTCTDATDKEFNVMENLEDESSWISERFPQFNIHKIENDKYEIGGSPSLVINGEKVSTGRDASSLLDAICAGFNVAPEECSTELSSASPSPGFGYSESSGPATTATCG